MELSGMKTELLYAMHLLSLSFKGINVVRSFLYPRRKFPRNNRETLRCCTKDEILFVVRHMNDIWIVLPALYSMQFCVFTVTHAHNAHTFAYKTNTTRPVIVSRVSAIDSHSFFTRSLIHSHSECHSEHCFDSISLTSSIECELCTTLAFILNFGRTITIGDGGRSEYNPHNVNGMQNWSKHFDGSQSTKSKRIDCSRFKFLFSFCSSRYQIHTFSFHISHSLSLTVSLWHILLLFNQLIRFMQKRCSNQSQTIYWLCLFVRLRSKTTGKRNG